jgi:hypothetical protein
VTERQKQIEKLGARLDPAVKVWIDRLVVPAIVREFLEDEAAREEPSLKFRLVAKCVRNELSAEGSQ